MRVCILIADSNGGYPVPASKGGAVSSLVESLIKSNNNNKLMEIKVVSFYDKDAYLWAKKYNSTTFQWIKSCGVFKLLDKITYCIAKIILKKEKTLSLISVWSLIYYIIRASLILRKEKFDRVILENNIPLAWSIKLSGYTGEYFYHLHNVPRINAGLKDVFAKCTGYLCVSAFVGRKICDNNNPIGPINKDKIKILYNCIDINKFQFNKMQREKIRSKYKVADDDCLIIFVGRISREKGVDVVLKALKEIKSKCKVMIVGSYMHGLNIKDDYHKEVRCLSDEIENRVIWTGFISQGKISSYYSAADIAVLPSMWDEPAGLTMIEAMACGLPVITTNSGGIPEYSGGKSIMLDRNKKLVDNIVLQIKSIINQHNIDTTSAKKRVIEHFNEDDYAYRFYNAIQ